MLDYQICNHNLKTAIKNQIGVTLRMNIKMFSGNNLLTKRDKNEIIIINNKRKKS